ncbi:Disulfide isomerase [Rhizoctonia solani]|uniref:Protein disulfide-isomerase n=1 Tax=Rhizoctonia solani TaxID=456999 RepID=A0A8H7INI8_9AGAM|nr:Disulfide isomerase [Rhizoctonia solani]
MSLPRIVKANPARTAFFICDLQERIRTSWDVIWKFNDIVYTSNKMLKMAKILSVPVLTTEQHPRVFGSTVPELKYDGLESHLNLGVFSKSKFSMITQEVEEVIKRSDITDVVLMGIESQICITQTTIDLLRMGIDVHVLADGVSSCNREEIPWALARMRQAGAQITTSESMLYQLIAAMKEERERSKQVLNSLGRCIPPLRTSPFHWLQNAEAASDRRALLTLHAAYNERSNDPLIKRHVRARSASLGEFGNSYSIMRRNDVLSNRATSSNKGHPTFVSASDVLDLNNDTFKTTVDGEELILVEFFAPWCGHCKALAPQYEEAATTLKAAGIKLAKVDCTENSDLCQANGVGGYPTLKVFRHGKDKEYSGPRKADGIVSYMKKQALPALSSVTGETHSKFIKDDKVVVVAYVDSDSDDLAKAIKAAAEDHRDDYLFGLATDAAAIKEAGVTAPALVVYKVSRVDLPAASVKSATSESLVSFIKENSVPLLDEISGENYANYAQSGIPLAYLFLDPTESNKDAKVAEFTSVAKKFKGKINFVWIDAIKYAEHGKALNLLEAKWPAFVIDDMANSLKYPHDQSGELTPASVTTLVESYLSGSLKPLLKSEAVPESNDGPVFTLVGSQFEDVIFDDSKDVLAEFYAPWCGHCKRLAPIYDQLGEQYADQKDKLTILKMDATTNDLPASAGFKIAGFPTIKFKPAGSKTFVDYEGDRSLESLTEFIQTNAKNNLTQPKPSAAETETAASSTADATSTPVPEATQATTHEEL